MEAAERGGGEGGGHGHARLEEIETWLIALKNAAARHTSTQLEMEFQSPPTTSAAHPASGSTGGSLTQSEMLAELHAGRNSQLHHSQSLVLDVDEGLESLRLESSSRRDDESPLDADDFRLEDGFRRANGDLEEGGGEPDDDTPTPRSQARRARATMRYTMKQLGKVGRRDSGLSPSKPKPVLHPKVKKVAEQFFEKVRSADPVERINSVLSSTRREFKSSAHTVIMLMVGFSLCNIAWHVLLSWFLVKHEGSVGWILMAPTGFFYVLVAAVVALALSSVNSIDVNVKVQAAGLRRVWEGVKEAEQTFWEQSESVAEHIQTLEQLVKRLENPAKSAMDEALEIVTDKVRARRHKFHCHHHRHLHHHRLYPHRRRHHGAHRRSSRRVSRRARSSAAGCTAPSSTAAAAPPSSSLWRGASPRCSRRREAATRRRLGRSCARSRRSCAACGPKAARTAAAAAAAAAGRAA